MTSFIAAQAAINEMLLPDSDIEYFNKNRRAVGLWLYYPMTFPTIIVSISNHFLTSHTSKWGKIYFFKLLNQRLETKFHSFGLGNANVIMIPAS